MQCPLLFITGPIASVLVNIYSCRTITMVGAVIGAIGFILSPFAPAMWFLYLSFGIVAGNCSVILDVLKFFWIKTHCV